MLRRFIATATFAMIAATTAPASATTLAFSGSGVGISFTGTFDATQTGPNSYLVTDVSGIQTQGLVSSAIDGISTYAGADEILNGSPLLPDFGGISFQTVALGDFNLFTNGGLFELASTTDPIGYPQNGVVLTSFDVHAVPEPITLSLFGAGLAGAAALRRRRRRIAKA